MSDLPLDHPVGRAFSRADIDEILNATHGPALRDVIDQRIEQLVEHGHDRESDKMLPVHELAHKARTFTAAGIEQITANAERRNLPVARKNMVRAAALLLAQIDRLDDAIAIEERTA